MHMKSVSAETDAETPAARVLCALQHAREGWCFAGRRAARGPVGGAAAGGRGGGGGGGRPAGGRGRRAAPEGGKEGRYDHRERVAGGTERGSETERGTRGGISAPLGRSRGPLSLSPRRRVTPWPRAATRACARGGRRTQAAQAARATRRRPRCYMMERRACGARRRCASPLAARVHTGGDGGRGAKGGRKSRGQRTAV